MKKKEERLLFVFHFVKNKTKQDFLLIQRRKTKKKQTHFIDSFIHLKNMNLALLLLCKIYIYVQKKERENITI